MSIKVGQRYELTAYDELHPGRFLKAHRLQGKPRTLTVKDFHCEGFDGAKGGVEVKGVLSFEETPLQYCTQKTNEELLIAIFGPDPRAVIGKRVTFFPDKDKFGRDLKDAIRVYGSPELSEPKDHTVHYAAKTGRRPKTFTLRPSGYGGEWALPGTEDASEPVDEDIDGALVAVRECESAKDLDTMAKSLKAETAQWSREAKLSVSEAIQARRKELSNEDGGQE